LFALPRVNSGEKSGSLHSNIAANQDSQASKSIGNSSFAREERSIDSSIKAGPIHSNDSSMEEMTDSQVVSLATISQAFPSESRGGDATFAWMADTDPHIPGRVTSHAQETEFFDQDRFARITKQLLKIIDEVRVISRKLAHTRDEGLKTLRRELPEGLRQILDRHVILLDISRASPFTTPLFQDTMDEYAAATDQLHSHYLSRTSEIFWANRDIYQEAGQLKINVADVQMRLENALKTELERPLADEDLPEDQSDGTPLQDEVFPVTSNTDTTAPDTTPYDVTESPRESQEMAHEVAGTTQLEPENDMWNLGRQALETISRDDATAERDDLLLSLWYPEMFDRQRSIRPPCADTFDWIYEDAPVTETDSHRALNSSFPRFLAGDQPLFWITGTPGSGKSTMMRMIESDRRTQEHLSGRANGRTQYVASHYFNRPGSTLQNCMSGLLRSLIYQLVQADPFRTHSPMSAKDWGHPSWTRSDLLRLLMEILHELSSARVYLMVDGLDECEGEQHELIDLIFVLQKLEGVKICVAGRPLPFLGSRLMRPPDLMLDEANAGDISTFVRARLARFANEIPKGLAMTLVKRSERSFIEAEILVDVVEPMLVARADEKTMRRRIDEMPTSAASRKMEDPEQEDLSILEELRRRHSRQDLQAML
jgi:hypothetical protein